MKLRTSILSAAALVAGALGARAAFQEGMPVVKPGPEHELLKQMAGTWEAEVEFMGMPSKGVYNRTLAMNDMWVVSDYESSMMGQDFIGHDVTGWDAQKKKYVSCWVDSMATYLGLTEGSWDPATKTLTMTGETLDPVSGEATPMVNVTRFVDADHQVFEMHVGGPDAPAAMTIKYSRKK